MPKKEVADAVTIKRVLTRVPYGIIERNKGIQDIVLVEAKIHGIYTIQHLAERLKQLEDIDVPVGELDVILYRDDVRDMEEPELHSSNVPVPIKGKEVILVDDVLYTGRTIRVAMDAVMGLSHPRKISLAILVNRGHQGLPIRADYVGKSTPTSETEKIIVEMGERDGADRIMIGKESK